MGVKGLWQLLDSVGRPVSLESMENKVLAIDTSIWLHQAISGFRDGSGNPVANAHLLSLFSRICKLLMYKIKPVFVFDGVVPQLKKRTMKLRREQRKNATDDVKKIRQKILLNLVRSHAIKSKLDAANNSEDLEMPSSSLSSRQQPDIFELPSLSQDKENWDSEDETSTSDSDNNMSILDRHQYLNSLDVESKDFKALPLEIQHELLSEMKESRKRHSWTKIDQLPSDLNDFSSFQMQALLKKRDLQRKIENTQKAMEIQQTNYITGETFENQFAESRRIVSEDSAHYLLVKGPRNVSSTPITQQRNQSVEKVGFSVDDNAKESGRGFNVQSEKKVDFIVDDAKKSEIGFHEIHNTIDTLEKGMVAKHDNLEKGLKDECDNLSKGLQDTCITLDSETISVCNDATKDSVHVKVVNSDQNFPDVITVDVSESSSDDDNTIVKSCIDKSSVMLEAQVANIPVEVPADGKNLEENMKSKEENLPVKMQVEDKNKTPVEVIDVISSDSEEDVMEIVIDPTTAVEDELFPKEIFAAYDLNEPKTLPVNQITSDITSNIHEEPEERMNVEELEALQMQLSDDTKNLILESGKLERTAQTLTDQMCLESQELLRLFGVPYVPSPTEAEAQCATLDRLGLTDGTITDDSDIWLFGGRKVYKNFYNQSKNVMIFTETDITNRLVLNRSKMIALSLLTGSDYTVGIKGIGIVSAMEILAEFPNDDGVESLRAFRAWWDKRQKQKKPPSSETKVKQKLAKLLLSEGFPSSVVVEAYLSPTVDESRQEFSWAMPDLDSLRQFANVKFGWTRSKIDAMLLPVMKRMNEKRVQTTLNGYFNTVSGGSSLIRSPSKRLGRAIAKVASAGANKKENPRSKLKRAVAKRIMGKVGTKAKRPKVVNEVVNLSEIDSSSNSD